MKISRRLMLAPLGALAITGAGIGTSMALMEDGIARASCMVQTGFDQWSASGVDANNGCLRISIQAQYVLPGNVYGWTNWKCSTPANPDTVTIHASEIGGGAAIVGVASRPWC